MADFYELLALINQDHPDIFALLQKPGVLKVALDMVNAEQEGKPWTQAQIDAKLQSTEYWQTTTSKARAWDQLQITDPATARTRGQNTIDLINDLSSQYGVNLSKEGGFGSNFFQFYTLAVREGWSADQVKYHLLASVNKTTTGGGDLGDLGAQVKKQFDDYGVPISDATVMKYAQQLGQGALDAQAIKGYAEQQALSLFPSLKDPISRGISVRQFADPYLQIAQQELGIDPANVSLTDQKWLKALNQVDPKTAVAAPMNLSDWVSTVRTDPTYGYDKTTKAKTQAAGFATKIAQEFGATG